MQEAASNIAIMEENCAFLPLVGCPCSDAITIKLYGVNGLLNQPALHPILSYWTVKTEFESFDQLRLT